MLTPIPLDSSNNLACLGLNSSDKDFSRFGRINDMLKRRLELLTEVGELARSLGMTDDVAYTCETAGHFFLFHILSRWEKFQADVAKFRKSLNNGGEGKE